MPKKLNWFAATQEPAAEKKVVSEQTGVQTPSTSSTTQQETRTSLQSQTDEVDQHILQTLSQF